MSGSNCCFLTCIQISQEAGQVVWYSYLLKNFPQFVDFPGGSDGKSVCLQCRRHGFNPWFGKIPLGKEMATHSSILVWKISWMDGGAWWAIVHAVTSQTWLSDFTSLHFTSLHIVKGFDIVNKAEVNVFLELSCFLMTQRMLAICSLVPLHFLNPPWTSGISCTLEAWLKEFWAFLC